VGQGPETGARRGRPDAGALESTTGSVFTVKKTTRDASGPRSAAARRSSAAMTGQMSWQGESKKVSTTASPRSSASDTAPPDWSTSEKDGAGVPPMSVIPMKARSGAPTSRADVGGAGGAITAVRAVTDVGVVDAAVVPAPGLRPTLDSRCSPRTPADAEHGEDGQDDEDEVARHLGLGPTEAAARSASDSAGVAGGCSVHLGRHRGTALVPPAISVDPDDGVGSHGDEERRQVGDRESEQLHGPTGTRVP